MRASWLFPLLAFGVPTVLAAQTVHVAVVAPEAASALPSAPGEMGESSSSFTFVASRRVQASPYAAIFANDLSLATVTDRCRAGARAAGDLASAGGQTCAGAGAVVYDRFVDSPEPVPLSGEQKAHLAVHNLLDPGNIATISGGSAFTILTNAHTAYGPGFIGLGRSVGVGLLQDATGQFFGTWAIPALTGEDPRYHRMPHASIPRRFFHAVAHTVVAESDTGRPMLNWSTLGTYPATAEISNLYVPGIHGNGPSTVARILTGLATDPVGNLITEFLPDVARHVQVHVLFTEQINQVASQQYPLLP